MLTPKARAAHRINKETWRLSAQVVDSHQEMLKLRLRNLAKEIKAVEQINPERAKAVREQFSKLFKAGQSCELLRSHQTWDEFFTSDEKIEEDYKMPPGCFVRDDEAKEPPLI